MTSVSLRKLVALPMVVLKRQVYRRFMARLAAPDVAQREKLTELLKQLRGSAFAKDYDLARVRTPEDLRKALPVASYERMAPYIERVKAGETTALFAPGTRVRMFATTSGTTAAVKYIPVTSMTLAEYLQSWTVWGYGVARDYPEVPYGGIINMASNWRSSQTPSGVPIGSVTGLLFEIMHRFLRVTNAVPPIVAQVSDVDLRYYLTLRLGLARQDTMMFNVANPATLLNFAERLGEWHEDLIRDLRDGTLHNSALYPKAVINALRSNLSRSHKATASRLEQVVMQTNTLQPKHAWPALAVIGVWTGGTLGAYLPRLVEPYGDLPLRDHGLSASEGRVTIPLESHVPYGALNLGGGYFEFIPEEEYGKVDPMTLGAHQLDSHQRYYVVMTTSGGLVRYDLSDVVECVGHEGRTPLLKFLNKGRHISSLTGEKLSAFQVTSATTIAFARLMMPFKEYILAPEMAYVPGYHLLIEARDLPSADVRNVLAKILDEELGRQNFEYAERRQSRRLQAVVVTGVPNGTFARIRDAKVHEAGTPVEHYKHPFLVTDPEFIRRFGATLEVLSGSA